MGACEACINKETMDAISTAGSGLGDSLLDKGQETGKKILDKVDDKLTKSMDKIIDDKLSKLENQFDSTVELMIDKTISAATHIFEETTDQLKDRMLSCKISKKLVKQMEKAQLLDTSKWEYIDDEQLKNIGFKDNDIEKWKDVKKQWKKSKSEEEKRNKIRKEQEQKRKEIEEKQMTEPQKAKKKLLQWHIPIHLINAMDQEGWLNIDYWHHIDRKQLASMGFKSGHTEIFMTEYAKYAETIQKQNKKPEDEEHKDDQNRYPQNKLLRVPSSSIESKEEKKHEIQEDVKHEIQEEENKYSDNDVDNDADNDANDNIKQVHEEEVVETDEKSCDEEENAKVDINWRELLVSWGIPYSLIDKMESQGWTECDYWDSVDEDAFDNMGFNQGHVILFKRKYAEWKKNKNLDEQQESDESNKSGDDWKVLLKKWGIPKQLADNMTSCGWTNIMYWDKITIQEFREMNFNRGHIILFTEEYNKWCQMQKDSEELRSLNIPDNIIKKIVEEKDFISAETWINKITQNEEKIGEKLRKIDHVFDNDKIEEFKQQHIKWKDLQKNSELLRRAPSTTQSTSGLLKRNIYVSNETKKTVIQVSIKAERKYGSFEQASASQQKQNTNRSKSNDRQFKKVINVANNSIGGSSAQSAQSEQRKDRSFNIEANAVAATAPVQIGLKGGQTRTDEFKSMTNAASTYDNTSSSNQQNEKQMSTLRDNERASNVASTNNEISKHEWKRIEAGYTAILPGQKIPFPVQISGPNHVVYMTIYIPSQNIKLCEHVQIDCNHIKVATRLKIEIMLKSWNVPNEIINEMKKNDLFDEDKWDSFMDKDLQELGFKQVHISLWKKAKEVSKNLLKNKKNNVEKMKKQKYKNDNKVSYDSKEDEKKEYVNDDKAKMKRLDSDLNGNSTDDENDYMTLSKPTKYDTEDESENNELHNVLLWRSNKSDSDSQEKEDWELLLKSWDIPKTYIEKMRESGWTHPEYWHKIRQEDFLFMQFRPGHIVTFKEKCDEWQQEQQEMNEEDELEIYWAPTSETKKEHSTQNDKQKKEKKWSNYKMDSDDEELDDLAEYIDIDSFTLLSKWGLEQFSDRLIDEGWNNPLDWVHISNEALRDNLGLRPGHIRTFNRKYTLWMKKYNETKKTRPVRIKGKDGVLVVQEGQTKMLNANQQYEYTKIVIQKNGLLTVKAWTPVFDGGTLLIQCHSKIIIQKGGKIDVSCCGLDGGTKEHPRGYGKGGGGNSSQDVACGGGGGFGTIGMSVKDGVGGRTYSDVKLSDGLLLGSGGAYVSDDKISEGGGALKLECNQLIMGPEAAIKSDGRLVKNETTGFECGGSGGSIWIVVHDKIEADETAKITALGGGHKEGSQGYGGNGRIRIDTTALKIGDIGIDAIPQPYIGDIENENKEEKDENKNSDEYEAFIERAEEKKDDAICQCKYCKPRVVRYVFEKLDGKKREEYTFNGKPVKVSKPTNVDQDTRIEVSGKLKLKYIHGFNKESTLNLSNDNKYLIYFVGRIIVVFDHELNKQTFYTKHNADINVLCLSPNDTLCASVQKVDDKSAKRRGTSNVFIWDYETLMTKQLIKNVSFGQVDKMYWSSYSDYLYCIDVDNKHFSLQVWDAAKFGSVKLDANDSLIKLPLSKKTIYAFATNPNPKKGNVDELVIVGNKISAFCVISKGKKKNDELIADVKSIDFGHNGAGTNKFKIIQFIDNGRYVIMDAKSFYICRNDKALKIYTHATADENYGLFYGRHFKLKGSINGKLSIVAFVTREKMCKDIEHEKKEVYKNEENDTIWRREMNTKVIPNVTSVDTIAFIGVDNDKEIVFIASENCITKYVIPMAYRSLKSITHLVVGCQICADDEKDVKDEKYVDGFGGLCVSPHNSCFAACSRDYIQVWNAETMKHTSKTKSGRINNAVWLKNDTLLASSALSIVEYWLDKQDMCFTKMMTHSLESYKEKYNARKKFYSQTFAMRISEDEEQLAILWNATQRANINSRLFLCSIKNGCSDIESERKALYSECDELSSFKDAQFAAGNKLIKILTDSDKNAFRYCKLDTDEDNKDDEKKDDQKNESEKGALLDKAPDADTKWTGKPLIVGWDVQALKQSEHFDATDLNDIAVTSDKKLIVSGDKYGKLRLHNYPATVSSKCLPKTYSAHSESVGCVAFVHDDAYLISLGQATGIIFQWELIKKEEKLIIPDGWGSMSLAKHEMGIQVHSQSGYSTVIGNCKLTRGKWYYEIQLTIPERGQFGWGLHTQNNSSLDLKGTGDDVRGWAYDGYRAKKYHNGHGQEYGTEWKANDIIGCAVDIDQQTMNFYLNGKNMGVAFRDFDPGDGIAPSITIARDGEFIVITDQNKLTYNKSGYKPLILPYTEPIAEKIDEKKDDAKDETDTVSECFIIPPGWGSMSCSKHDNGIEIQSQASHST
eukprot:475540_1